MTSVDWKDSTFVSCSDDKTLRVYCVSDKQEFTLNYVLSTAMITAWHTLTYMHLQDIPGKPYYLLSAVSENGYLFCWHISQDSSDLKYARKIHNGSIEALQVRLRGEEITGVCCSSDCSFSILSFDLN